MDLCAESIKKVEICTIFARRLVNNRKTDNFYKEKYISDKDAKASR